MELNFKLVKDYINNNTYNSRQNQRASKLIGKILELVDESNIQILYPKYIFVDEKEIEFYVFDIQGNIIKCFIDSSGAINTVVFGKRNILSINLVENYKDSGDLSLTVKLTNGDTYEFSSLLDTNEYHKISFSNIIRNIGKHLVQLK